MYGPYTGIIADIIFILVLLCWIIMISGIEDTTARIIGWTGTIIFTAMSAYWTWLHLIKKHLE